MGVGANTLQIITEKGLKKCKVAEKSGIKNSRFSKIIHEKLEPDSKEIISICNTLEITPNDLFGISKS